MYGSNEETKDNNEQSWGLLLVSLANKYAYSHHMTSYLEAVGAVFKAYNRHCQLTRVLCAEYNITVDHQPFSDQVMLLTDQCSRWSADHVIICY